METDHPTFGHGKICYLEIPAGDIELSSNFYETVFGWKIRRDSDGNTSFDDGVGEVSGMWVLNRKPANEIGIAISIMVLDITATITLIELQGGSITSAFNPKHKTAGFTDPFGNFLGLYQH